MKPTRSQILWILSLVMCVLAVQALTAPQQVAWAQESTWSHAVNACAIDETNVSEYLVGLSFLSHRAPFTGLLTARCNVENLPIASGKDRLRLELVYRDQDGAGTAYRVSARLLAINNFGAVDTLAVVNSNTFPASTSFQTQSTPFSHDFDFFRNAYYVKVTVLRSNPAQMPAAAVVRIAEALIE